MPVLPIIKNFSQFSQEMTAIPVGTGAVYPVVFGWLCSAASSRQ
jgi:hypothetical protein